MRGAWWAAQALRLAYAPGLRAFRGALNQPELAQAEALRGLLAWAAPTAYGRAHGFERLARLQAPGQLWRAYRSSVPLQGHEDLAPWLERMWAGEPGVLVPGQPLAWEATSGSTSGRKLLPITTRYRAELQRATGPWLASLYGGPWGLAGGLGYWSISPAARLAERSPGGIPVGLEDDTAYFSTAERWVVQRLVLQPPGLRGLTSLAAHRHVSLVHLLSQGEALRLISVWHPSFLSLLLEAATASGEDLARALREGRIQHPELSASEATAASAGLRPDPRRAMAWLGAWERARASGRQVQAQEAFPGLRLLSAWADGPAAGPAAALQAEAPGVAFQPKGLLATEGVLTLPWGEGPGGVAAIRSHALELLPEGGGEPLGLHEAPLGLRATLAMSTGGGLFRRRLEDLVEVVGHEGRTPRLRFLGKADLVSDLVGEKLGAPFVEACWAEALASCGLPASSWCLLAPQAGPPARYEALVGPPFAGDRAQGHALLAALEAALSANPHWGYARRLGQLGPLALRQVGPEAEAKRLAWWQAQGRLLGGVKPSRLAKEAGWGDRLGAKAPRELEDLA